MFKIVGTPSMVMRLAQSAIHSRGWRVMNNDVVARIDHVVRDTLGSLLRTGDVRVLDDAVAVSSDWCVVGIEMFGDVAWEMTLAMPAATARRLTAALMADDDLEVSPDDVVDAASELLNIVAGRCRAASDVDTSMGVPSLRRSSHLDTSTAAVHRWFAWGHDVLCFSTRTLAPC
jgi:CheY-specific phosphatase CheX